MGPLGSPYGLALQAVDCGCAGFMTMGTGSTLLFMAITCSAWAASSSVGGTAPLCRLKLFH